MDNPKTLASLGKQDTRQTKHKHMTQKTKTMSNKTGTGSTVSKMSHRNEGGCDIRVYNY
jgi:hypothetical protein